MIYFLSILSMKDTDSYTLEQQREILEDRKQRMLQEQKENMFNTQNILRGEYSGNIFSNPFI